MDRQSERTPRGLSNHLNPGAATLVATVGGMVSMDFTTVVAPEEVLARACRFFTDWGLKVSDEGDYCATFTGGVGSVCRFARGTRATPW